MGLELAGLSWISSPVWCRLCTALIRIDLLALLDVLAALEVNFRALHVVKAGEVGRIV
jgi:hypothetical protein